MCQSGTNNPIRSQPGADGPDWDLLSYDLSRKEGLTMRKYTLASMDRDSVDLRVYVAEIINAVHEVMPTAQVRVDKDCYYVSPTPTKGDAIRIGRKICESDLKHYCIKVSKLFNSVEIGGQDGAQKQSKTYVGGHK